MRFRSVFLMICIPVRIWAQQNGLNDALNVPPLIQAVLDSREDHLVQLLASGADPDLIADVPQPVSALSLAIERGEWDMVQRLEAADGLLLAESGAPNPLNLPELSVPLNARLFRQPEIIRKRAASPDWRENPDRWDLHLAAAEGDWRYVRSELDFGRETGGQDYSGVTPLMVAAWHGHESVVSLLLQRGADPFVQDSGGFTALCYAAASGRLSAVRQLAGQHSADSLEHSALFFALGGRHHQILDELLKAGASPNLTGAGGVTALMTASWLSDAYAVRTLLDFGAEVFVRDDAGLSAPEWSLAAFVRDRETGRQTGDLRRGERNYAVLRLLIGEAGTDLIHPSVFTAWSPVRSGDRADDWRDISPSPVPLIPGDGDLDLYRILLDEEQPEM